MSTIMRTVSLMLLAAGWGAAAPSSQQKRQEACGQGSGTQPSTFTVPQIKNGNFRPRSGLEEMLRTFAKFNAELTPELHEAIRINAKFRLAQGMEKRGNVVGTVAAYPPGGYDYEYLSPVKIGTPAQTVYLDFDTGSADLWVFSADTPKAQVVGQGLYRPVNSSTSKKLNGYTWKISYGDGSGSSGIVYTDRVAIGNAVYANQSVQSATLVSPEFTSDSASSGLLGLGMGSGSTVRPAKQATFLENIRSSLFAPLFTANLKHGVPGNYNFGYLNLGEYAGAMGYTPIDARSIYWKFNATGYQLGARAPYSAYSWAAIADTGTTLLLLPDKIVSAYYAQIKGAAFDPYWGGILFPCSATPPDFVFSIAGSATYRGTVPGRYMNYGQVNRTTCYGGIQSSAGIGFSIFGDIALKAQFVVFDLGNKRLGFANKNLST